MFAWYHAGDERADTMSPNRHLCNRVCRHSCWKFGVRACLCKDGPGLFLSSSAHDQVYWSDPHGT